MMSDFDNPDIMIGSENINSIERELANTINTQTIMTVSLILMLGEIPPRKMNLDLSKYVVPIHDRFLETMETKHSQMKLI